MDWSALAGLTLGAIGEPVAFFRNGQKIIELNGIFRTEQQNKQSKSKAMRVIDCDTVTVECSELIQSGDEVRILATNSCYLVAGRPVRDSSGGMIVRLSDDAPDQTIKSEGSRFDKKRPY